MAPIATDVTSSSAIRWKAVVLNTRLYHSWRRGLKLGSTAGIILTIWQLSNWITKWRRLSWIGTIQSGLDCTEMVKKDKLASSGCYYLSFFFHQYSLSLCDFSSNVCSAGGTFKWSTGVSTFLDWASGEPRNNGDCVSILSHQKKMATQDCSALFPFVCLRDNLVLVKENKTWEEALEHCRGLDPSNPRYELLSIQPEADHMYVMTTVMQRAVTEKVGVYV